MWQPYNKLASKYNIKIEHSLEGYLSHVSIQEPEIIECIIMISKKNREELLENYIDIAKFCASTWKTATNNYRRKLCNEKIKIKNKNLHILTSDQINLLVDILKNDNEYEWSIQEDSDSYEDII